MYSDPDYPELFMKAFVEIVDELADKKGFNKKQFAEALWPDSPPRGSNERWHKMRNGYANKRIHQGVLISDSIRMAKVLDEPLPMIMLKAEHRVEEWRTKAKGSNAMQ